MLYDIRRGLSLVFPYKITVRRPSELPQEWSVYRMAASSSCVSVLRAGRMSQGELGRKYSSRRKTHFRHGITKRVLELLMFDVRQGYGRQI